jgi:hypothetical protein
MKKYVIEREIPNIGTLEPEQLREAAAKSTRCSASLDQTFSGRNLLSLLTKRSVCIWLKMRQSSVGTPN